MGLLSKFFNPFSSEDKEKDYVESLLPEDDTSGQDESVNVPLPKEQSDETSKKETAFVSNVVELRESVKDSVTRAVVRFTGKDDFLGMKIWVNDSSYSELNSDSFKRDLLAAFDDMHFFSLGSGTLEVVYGRPDESVVATELSPNRLWVQLLDRTNSASSSSKARISVVMDMGALDSAFYELDSGIKDRFRIGRGRICRRSGSYRINDVIISEKPADQEILKLNQHVSSSQADIVIKDGLFYLQAMPSGCRPLGGAPTKIIRDQEAMELRDASSFHQLQNGDMIELGKSVLLLFEYL